MVAASADKAISNARSTTRNNPGMCLWYTQEWLESPHAYPDATTQWANAKHRHPGDKNPPKGAPVFWTGGSHGYGHACISLGGGRIRTIDCKSSGYTNDTDIGWITSSWGLPYGGWTEDIGNVDIPWLRGGASAGGGGNKGGVLGMTNAKSFSRNTGQLITGNGNWHALYLDNDSKTYSFIAGPLSGYVVTTGLSISKLSNLTAEFCYATASDYSDDRATVYESYYPVDPIIGQAGGNSRGVLTWSGDLGKSPKSGATLKLRLLCKPPDGVQINISRLTSRILY